MPSAASSFDVAVVGGGVIGLAVAWRAAQRGAARGRARARRAGRRHLARGRRDARAGQRGRVSPSCRCWRSGWRARTPTRSSSPSCSDATGLDPGYLRCGTLLAARDRDEAEALERELELRDSLGSDGARGCGPARRGGSSPRWRPTLRLALDVARRPRDRPAQADRGAGPRRCAAAGGELRAGRRGHEARDRRRAR